MRSQLRKIWFVAAASVLLAGSGWAQLQVGDNLNMRLNGTLNAGYSASNSDPGASSHALDLGGTLQLNGFYFDPKFISFTVVPYANRDQNNSTVLELNRNNGVTASANFFSGSHFPGFFSFTRDSNDTGTFGIPGDAGLTMNGSSTGWSIGWSEIVPKLPSFSATFGRNASSGAVYGEDGETVSHSSNLNLNSSYSIFGFDLNGSFQRNHNEFTMPSFFLGGLDTHSDATMDSLLFHGNHRLPMKGNVSFSAAWQGLNSEFASMSNNNTGHSYSTNAFISPSKRITISGNVNYSDNVTSVLDQQLVLAGAAPITNLGQLKSVSTEGGVGINPFRGFYITADATHITQHYQGGELVSTQFRGIASYRFAEPLLGMFTLSGGVVDTTTELGHSGLGAVATMDFARRFGRWNVTGRFGYLQSLQTLLGVENTSSYSFGGSIERHVGNFDWINSVYGAHTGFTVVQGDSSSSESFRSSLATRRYIMSATWSTSAGTSVLTANGLVTVPTGLPAGILPPDRVILYNARSYGFAGTIKPMRKMYIDGNYNVAHNSSILGLSSSLGDTNILNLRLRYPFRKMYFNAGYTRLNQSVTAVGGHPISISSYFFGISRWFDFF